MAKAGEVRHPAVPVGQEAAIDNAGTAGVTDEPRMIQDLGVQVPSRSANFWAGMEDGGL